MNIGEDTINPIINLFHKLLGNNLWILPVAIAIASWCIYYYYPDKWVILYVGIICSLIAILYIFSNLFWGIKNAIIKHKKKETAKAEAIKKREHELAVNELKELEHATTVWKLVAHLDNDIIEAASLFLSLEIHDEDKHVRFVKIPYNQYSPECKLYNLYFEVINKLTFYNSYRSSNKMISEERVGEIMYFHIDHYFMRLLENYRSTKRWVKL